jgi:hypothetical protein
LLAGMLLQQGQRQAAKPAQNVGQTTLGISGISGISAFPAFPHFRHFRISGISGDSIHNS